MSDKVFHPTDVLWQPHEKAIYSAGRRERLRKLPLQVLSHESLPSMCQRLKESLVGMAVGYMVVRHSRVPRDGPVDYTCIRLLNTGSCRGGETNSMAMRTACGLIEQLVVKLRHFSFGDIEHSRVATGLP